MNNRIIMFLIPFTVLTSCSPVVSSNSESTNISDTGSSDNQVTERYTVIWKNFDETVLEVDENVENGTIPSYDGETPEKAKDDEFSYTFSGWTPEVVAVSGDVTYTARFSENINTYTVTWKNYDGTVLEVDENVEYGTIPSYDGETLEKAKDDEFSYTFSGWTPEVVAVSGDVTYIARFSENINTYTGTWKNYDGTVLEVDENVEYGTIPSYDGETPEKAKDDEFSYTFNGWTPELSIVTESSTYTAQFSSEVIDELAYFMGIYRRTFTEVRGISSTAYFSEFLEGDDPDQLIVLVVDENELVSGRYQGHKNDEKWYIGGTEYYIDGEGLASFSTRGQMTLTDYAFESMSTSLAFFGLPRLIELDIELPLEFEITYQATENRFVLKMFEGESSQLGLAYYYFENGRFTTITGTLPYSFVNTFTYDVNDVIKLPVLPDLEWQESI